MSKHLRRVLNLVRPIVPADDLAKQNGQLAPVPGYWRTPKLPVVLPYWD